MKGKTRLGGQAGCYGSLAGVFLLLWPAGADAHLVSTGFGPFYDGVMHLALSPDDLLSVLAIALLSGLCGARHARAALFTLPTAWVVAGWLGMQRATEASVPVASALSFLVVGALVAADLKVPWWLVAGLALALGLLHGFMNGTAMAQAGGGVTALLGTSAAVFVVVALVAAHTCTCRFRRTCLPGTPRCWPTPPAGAGMTWSNRARAATPRSRSSSLSRKGPSRRR